jgi:hypothetical protein
MSQRIEDLDVYGAVDVAKIPADIFEVSKNSGTSGSPIYLPADSRQLRLDELTDMIAVILPGGYVPLLTENYLVVTLTDSKTDNGENLRDAVTYALAATPYGDALAANNRFTVFLFPGTYDLGATGIKGLIALDNYVDIVGVGDAKDIIIISDDADGTIEVSTGADYILQNLSLKNTIGVYDIFHAAAATDNGKWVNLILYSKTTEGTVFAGWYEGLDCTNGNGYVLTGNITGTVINSRFKDRSCGALNNAGNITISGTIKNCTGEYYCFGNANDGNVTISGTIINCRAFGNSFGAASSATTGDVTISGIIQDCIGQYGSWGYSSGGGTCNVVISGTIRRCHTDTIFYQNNFGSSANGNVTISGTIEYCTSSYESFGYSNGAAATITISGSIIDCNTPVGSGASSCFGSLGSTSSGAIDITSTAIIRNCYLDQWYGFGATSSSVPAVTIAGLIENCTAANTSFGFIGGNGTVTISGKILKCTEYSGGGGSFGRAGSAPCTVNISGIIKDCLAWSLSFGSSADDLTISSTAIIKDCIAAGNQSFGFGYAGNVTIDGIIDNCKSKIGSGAYLCFGASTSGDVVIAGKIINCYTDSDQSFGMSGSGNVTISGLIERCISGTGNSFGYVAGALASTALVSGIIRDCHIEGVGNGFGFSISSLATVTVSGLIERCTFKDNTVKQGFGGCLGGTVNVSGIIKDCIAEGGYSFGVIPLGIPGGGGAGTVNITGKISNCIGGEKCFGSAVGELGGTDGTVVTSGTIENCIGSDSCFGDTTAAGKLINCIRTGGYGTHLGTIDRCIFSEDDAANPVLTLGANAIVRRSEFNQAGAGPCIFGAAIDADITYSRMNKVLDGVTNSLVDNAFNIGDVDVSYLILRSPDATSWEYKAGDDGVIVSPGVAL